LVHGACPQNNAIPWRRYRRWHHATRILISFQPVHDVGASPAK
jgi:hypothetical protein